MSYQTNGLNRDRYAQKGQTAEMLRLRVNPNAGMELKLPSLDLKKLVTRMRKLWSFLIQLNYKRSMNEIRN
jgi:hypothetical protein